MWKYKYRMSIAPMGFNVPFAGRLLSIDPHGWLVSDIDADLYEALKGDPSKWEYHPPAAPVAAEPKPIEPPEMLAPAAEADEEGGSTATESEDSEPVKPVRASRSKRRSKKSTAAKQDD